MRKLVQLLVAITMATVVVSCSNTDSDPAGSGLIEANEATISAEASGRLEAVYFDEGDKISRGDIIALIDTTKTALRLEKARVLYRAMQTQRENALIRIEQTAIDDSLAQKEFRRISRLVASGSANQQQYDRVENTAQKSQLARKAASVALESADAELARIEVDINLLREQLNDCQPTSPVSGTVVTSYVEQGELMAAGRPLLKIANLDSVWVKIYLPPADLTGIKLGDRAEVDPEDGRDQPLSGTVTWIADEAEFTPKNVQTREARADLVYGVKIVIPNHDQTLKIGMPVSVTIP